MKFQNDILILTGQHTLAGSCFVATANVRHCLVWDSVAARESVRARRQRQVVRVNSATHQSNQAPLTKYRPSMAINSPDSCTQSRSSCRLRDSYVSTSTTPHNSSDTVKLFLATVLRLFWMPDAVTPLGLWTTPSCFRASTKPPLLLTVGRLLHTRFPWNLTSELSTRGRSFRRRGCREPTENTKQTKLTVQAGNTHTRSVPRNRGTSGRSTVAR